MQDSPELTPEMQAALDAVFVRLPVHYRTEIIKAEIARAVARARVTGRPACEAAARSAVVEMFSTLDRVIAGRHRPAPASK